MPEKDWATGMTPPVQPAAPWRVTHIEVLSGFRLHVDFNDGVHGTVDLAGFVKSTSAGVFAALRDEALFRQAHVKLGAVAWPGQLDLAPDEMHRQMKTHGTWIVE
jgi:Protein of unknown function (DUF2442)